MRFILSFSVMYCFQYTMPDGFSSMNFALKFGRNIVIFTETNFLDTDRDLLYNE